MKRIKKAALLLVCTLTVAILPITASAVNEYCQRLVGGNQCGKLLRWHYTGRSISYEASHEYGGNIFGFNKSTCYYEYFIEYFEKKCEDGHVAGTDTMRIERGHDCN